MILNHIIMLRANARTETREMKIGLLTGGGDCPGLNAAIRAIVRRAFIDGVTIIGVKNGWEGLVKNEVTELSRAAVTGILPRGGTILGTSRFNPLKDEQSINQLLTPRAYAAVAVLSAFAIVLFVLLTTAERLALPWAYHRQGEP